MRYVNGKPIRKRGGSHAKSAERLDIHSKLDGRPAGTHSNHAHNLHGSSAAKLTIDAAKYYECATIEERPETHIVPRQSETRKQLLGVLPGSIETETRKGRQLDKRSGELIEVNDQRLTWKSDRTLLRRGKPFEEIGTFKREGSVSIGLNKRKTIRTEAEIVTVDATKLPALPDGTEPVRLDIHADLLGPALDDIDFDE